MRFINNQQNYSKKRNYLFSILLIFIYIIPFLTYMEGTVASIISVVVMIVILILWLDSRFYLVLPLFLFFYYQLVMPGGVVVFRIYSYLLFAKIILSGKFKFDKRFVIPFLLMTFYCLIVVGYQDERTAFSILFDTLLILSYISSYLFDKKKITSFFSFYVLAAVSSSVYGLLRIGMQMTNIMYVDNKWVEISRFLATFKDPNYVGFFFNVAIFSILSLEIIKNKFFKWCCLAILYATLLATISMTAFLCNLFGLIIFLILKKGVKIKNIVLIIVVTLLVMSIYNLALTSNIPVLTDVSLRIDTKISQLSSKDFESVTTERSYIWRTNFNYYKEQSFDKMLFGGNFITDYGRNPVFKTVSHNAYIDMLLNFGLIGTLIFLFSFIYTFIRRIILYLNHKDSRHLVIIMISLIWAFYAFGLSMFPSWSFNLFFFL